jgi:predicted GH43/DUF377 family glycosyl hydrolase
MMRQPDRSWVRRVDAVMCPDPKRVVTRIFLPGQEAAQPGESRSTVIIDRLLGLSDVEVADQLGAVRAAYEHRHRDLEAAWERNFVLIEHRVEGAADVEKDRRLLIGATFTQEFAIEAAALFNPSMVSHPDQSGLAEGSTRFLMTVRAVGEGHVSSVEFRTGTIDSSGAVDIDPPAQVAVLPSIVSARYSRAAFRQQLDDLAGDQTNSDFVLDTLPEWFSRKQLTLAVERLREERLTRGDSARTIERLEWIAACTYRVEFPEDSGIRERVLTPIAPSERNGMEDVRMVRFGDDDPAAGYLGTYTAYDGRTVAAQLVTTRDFRTFDMAPLNGPGSKDKGMALFPRRVGGRYLALSRADRESNGVSSSEDLRHWSAPVQVQAPERSWEIVQLGNCGPPIETEAGWLVLTHGVGPMRQYSIGALLLDLDDPTVVRGSLTEPLLTPAADERDGYVPNVVYSCGSLLHNRSVVVPYGCSDATTRIAVVDLDPLLGALTGTPVRTESP